MNSKLRRMRPIYKVAVEACERRLLLSTYTVNTLSDAVSPVTGQLTLRQAVADANANPGADTITFSPTVFTSGSLHTITLQQGEISLADNTTIQGPGQSVLTIDGNKSSRIFQISSGVTVAISGLTITDGSATNPVSGTVIGGGVLNAGTLNLTNVTVSNNTAYGGDGTGFNSSGGGIYSTGALTLVDSTISGNTSRGAGENYGTGGSAIAGGIYSGGTLNVSGSTISANTAYGGFEPPLMDGEGGPANGGGIYATGSLTLSSSTISNNLAHGGPGAQDNADQAAGAPAEGGGIWASGSSTLVDDTLANNSADGGSSSGGGGVAGAASGGAIFSTSSLTLTSSTLSTNKAVGGAGPFDDNGPGADGSGGAILAEGPLTLTDSSVLSNTAQGGGGQPKPYEVGASAYGGGIDAGASLSITGSTISGNMAQGSQGGAGGGTYSGPGGVGLGGGVITGGTAVITGSTITGNIATGGAGQQSYGGINYTGGSGGQGAGAGIYNGGTVTITDSTLNSNAAEGGGGGRSGGNGGSGGDGSGGAIYSSGTLSLQDTTVSGNTVAGGAGGVTSDQNEYSSGSDGNALGAAITISSGDALFSNTIIAGNTASGSTENDIQGTANASSGSNLIGTGSGGLTNGVNGNIVGVNDPQLMPLGNYGGPTQTMLPLYTSPAVNAGNNSLIPAGVTTDQRGYPRIAGPSVDIGADELQFGSVSGTVFKDLNGDGVRRTGDPGLVGVTVYADLSNAGNYQPGDPTTVTDSNGNYTLNGLPEGTRIVRQELPAGYRQSYPGLGAGEHVTVGTTPVTGALFADTTRLYIAGRVELNGVGHGGVLVYADLNHDGKFESNENNKTTASDGTFSFVSLAPGSYLFRVVVPGGETQIYPGNNNGIPVTLSSAGEDPYVVFTLARQLTGTVIGTSGSYNNQGNTAAKAFDGNLSTYFDAPSATGNWAGLDLGSARIITQISYAPRSGWAARMVGGIFQGSNSADFSSGDVTLYTVTSAPQTGVLTMVPISNWSAYRYVRYLGPAGSFCNIAEARFSGFTPIAGATLEPGGTLVVNGTNGADFIHVNLEFNENPSALVTINSIPQNFSSGVLAVVVNALAGDDTVLVDGDNLGPTYDYPYIPVTINGGDGNDTLTTNLNDRQSEQTVYVDGGGGDDAINIDQNGGATVVGGDGNDTVTSDADEGLALSVYGGNGNDTVALGYNTYLGHFDGGAGVNTLDVSQSLNNQNIQLQGANITNVHNVILGGVSATVIGTSGNDTITGGGGGLVSIQGGGGNDTIFLNGEYMVTINCAGPGASHITVYNSTDVTIIGGNGNDVIDARTSTAVNIDGGPGINTAYTEPGDIVKNIQILYPSNKLTGTVIGTPGSYRNHGTTIANAFDGNFNTFFDGPDASGDWVGLDLGSAKVVTEVQYAPRAGWETRMVGGEIQASNSANFTSGVATLYTITSAPYPYFMTTQLLTNPTAYRYYRYIGPANSYCDIAELEFLG